MDDDVINILNRLDPVSIGAHHSQLMTINGEFVSVQILGSNEPKSIRLTGLNSKYTQSCFDVWNTIMPPFSIYNSRKYGSGPTSTFS